jgi:hypothetical protein
MIMMDAMYFELVPYLRGLWTRSVAKVLCYYGHHDYEFDGVDSSDLNCGKLTCFYCQHEKRSHIGSK